MPRAKSNGGVRLGEPIAFRLSEADRAVYLENVAASGLTRSEFFRQAVLTNRTQGIARPKASDDRKRLLYAFNKTCNNQTSSRIALIVSMCAACCLRRPTNRCSIGCK